MGRCAAFRRLPRRLDERIAAGDAIGRAACEPTRLALGEEVRRWRRAGRPGARSGGDPAPPAAPAPAAPAPAALAPALIPGPVAHGGGAAQSRGGFRRGGNGAGPSSRSACETGGGPCHSAAGSAPDRAASSPSGGRPACVSWRCSSACDSETVAPGGGTADPTPPRVRAASRWAQSWKVGHTANALDRQYASW